MSDIVVAGYLGFENSGDEALLLVVLSEIRRRLPDATVAVLSADPKKTSARFGVRAVGRYDAAAIGKELDAARVLVFAGGTLIQDATSRRSLLYYLSLLRAAGKRGVKTMLFSNGIGPLCRRSSRKLAARELSRVDAITLRDGDSADLLAKIGVPSANVTVTADAAFLLPDTELCGGRDASFAGIESGKEYAVISVRGGGEKFVPPLCRFLSDVHGVTPLIVPMQYPRDLRASERSARASGVETRVWRAPFTAADAGLVMSGAALAVGMRLHLLIYAAVAGVPFVGIAGDPKIASFCRAVGMMYSDADGGCDALLRAVSSVISERGRFSERVASASERMTALARRSADILAGLF